MNWIAKTRKNLGITQEDLARFVGSHSITVSKWERGLLHPTRFQEAILAALADAGDKDPKVGRKALSMMAQKGLIEGLTLVFETAGHGGWGKPPAQKPITIPQNREDL